MKLSEYFKSLVRNPRILLWAFPLLLIVPNVLLDITEHYSWLSKLTNVALPLGFYYVLVSLSVKVGRSVLWMCFFVVFAAFQIVLLDLYGESIIAIDMFVNVATTNASEVGELLGNLLVGMIIMLLIYLPPIVLAVLQTARRVTATKLSLVRVRTVGVALILCGALTCVAAYLFSGSFMFFREIFPANVISNLVSAVDRTMVSQNYMTTSEGFTYDAVGSRPADMAEVYVVVIGETSRADNWQLMGYDRPTNPRLSKRTELLAFPKALSESNTTHKAVPMLLSHLDAPMFGDSVRYTKSLFEAYNSVGYATAFLSNQQRNHSYIDYFGEEAQTCRFLRDNPSTTGRDIELVDSLKSFLERRDGLKKMVVLHTYGSHFNYRERYPADRAFFKPDESSEASAFNRDELVNAYDNTIRYTDEILDSVISVVEACDVPAVVIYTSDHGEDIFDDGRKRFLHASPVGTYYQLHVPFVMWMSEEYREAFPEKYACAVSNVGKDVVSTRDLFHTLFDLSGMKSSLFDSSASLASPSFMPGKRFFLNDYLEGVALQQSGLHQEDFDMLSKQGISAR